MGGSPSGGNMTPAAEFNIYIYVDHASLAGPECGSSRCAGVAR